MNDKFALAMLICNSALACVTIVIMVLVILFRKKAVIRASSPMFLEIMYLQRLNSRANASMAGLLVSSAGLVALFFTSTNRTP